MTDVTLVICFADKVVIVVSSDLDELKKMLQDLNEELRQVGLKMNLRKTQLMSPEANVQLMIDNEFVENVQEYTYLGQVMKLVNEKQMAEIKRSVSLKWAW